MGSYGLGGVNQPPENIRSLEAHRELRSSMAKAQDFRKRDRVGSKAQAIVEEALTRRGKAYTVLQGSDPQQAYGDIRLDAAKIPTYVEVKANANYDDSIKQYNVYLELMEYYLPEYAHGKARRVEVSGFLKQMHAESRTLFAHKLGSTNRWLVYTPQSMLSYLLYSRETVWERDAVDSRADQDSKRKVGLRIKNLDPATLDEDFPRSQLSKYAKLVPASGLVTALMETALSYEEQDEDPVTAYRLLCRKYYSDHQLKTYKDWWTYPTSARLTKGN